MRYKCELIMTTYFFDDFLPLDHQIDRFPVMTET